jgi:hypothetical protein
VNRIFPIGIEAGGVCVDTEYVDTYYVFTLAFTRGDGKERGMNLTLSIDERLLKEARRAARSMGKSLNQLVRDYFEQLTARNDPQKDIEELHKLSMDGKGRSQGWRFNRSELHGRS